MQPISKPIRSNTTRLRAGLLVAAMTFGTVSSLTASSVVMAEASVADPKIAIRAVQATLPSVAILGQKAGPSDTTEVFIQVPGVLNMQSVYVLGDGRTVISGVVVPPIENGFPGSQLKLPDGNASVDPRAPRSGVDQLNDVLGMGNGAESNYANKATASSGERRFAVPELPRVRENQSFVSGKVIRFPKTETAEPTSAPAVAAEEPGSGNAPAPKAANDIANGGEILIESLADIAQSGAFSRVVGYMLENDSDIDALRNLSDQKVQQAGYLELVESRPAIVQGNSDRKVYALFDPNCPVCHRYYNEVSALVVSGQLEVHWIPAIVFPDNRSSLTASAALLAETQREGGDPKAMLEKVMTSDGYIQKIDSAPNVDRLVPYLDSVVKNTAVMAMARAETPLLVFKNVDGDLSISPGIPQVGYEKLIKNGS